MWAQLVGRRKSRLRSWVTEEVSHTAREELGEGESPTKKQTHPSITERSPLGPALRGRVWFPPLPGRH